jgi:hypothetical protein
MSTPNWANLVAQGRAKAHGVSWSEEEAAARVLGIPAEYVRSGILTLEDYEKAKKSDANNGAPLERLSRGELIAQAQKAGLEFTPEAPDSTLIQLLGDPKALKAAKAAQNAKAKAEADAAKEAAKAAKAAKK